MTYRRLALDSKAPTIVEQFVRVHLDMQFGDVHSMLRLPLAKEMFTLDLDPLTNRAVNRVVEPIMNGCNFAAANWILALLSGMSRMLFDGDGDDSTKRVFLRMVEKFYPWSTEPKKGVTDGHEGAENLYYLLRNPLTHDLGTDVPDDHFEKRPARLRTRAPVFVAKSAMTEKQIEELEIASENGARPNEAPVTFVPYRGGLLLHVPTLYWGARVTLLCLSADVKHMTFAEQRIRDASARATPP